MRSNLSGGLEWVFIIVALDAPRRGAAVAIRFMPRRTSSGALPPISPATFRRVEEHEG
jgi:hypothetical protein